MPSELQSLSDLFQNRLFRIPDYQRGYAWKHDQLVDFWEDLVNLNENRFHYTGLLSLKELQSSDKYSMKEDSWLIDNGFKLYHVVDGQQRLTTFSILLFEIVRLIKNHPDNKGKSDEEIFIGYESLKNIKEKYISRKRPPALLITTYLFGYETDNPSSDYLKHMVFEEPFGGTLQESYYTKNLKYAKEFFVDNLSELLNGEGISGIDQLYKKLTLRLMFNLHKIEDDYDVFVAFETMNNRGKKLTNLELLKNRLIYLTTLFDDKEFDSKDKENLRKNINDTWKEVYFQLGRNQAAPLSDDDFLKAHWITYFQYTRRKGDDYIRFLLSKFSAKNIFEKLTVVELPNGTDPLPGFDSQDEDSTEDLPDSEPIVTSKLSPKEISDYVNSLKDMAQYWYYSFFPHHSSDLSTQEKEWIDRLNRVGISYFRPLVVSVLAQSKSSKTEERVDLFKAIERFIFLSFRIGGFNNSYLSSEYNNKAREVSQGTMALKAITDDINETVRIDLPSIIRGFMTRTERRFKDGLGFYGWRDLRYFLYEYEYHLSIKNNLIKVDWTMFSKVEKDKVTIEHILPQTPTKWYWKNQFRQFTEAEIKTLSASLGNLLPLSQSINSSLQNDGFPEKKIASASGRRGYSNGSHSEIEVSQEKEWKAINILNRGINLLKFMEQHWSFELNDEQRHELLHIPFVLEDRPDVPEITEVTIPKSVQKTTKGTSEKELSEVEYNNQEFWLKFVEYCHQKGRQYDIALKKPNSENYYNVMIGSTKYHLFFQLVYRKLLRIGIYVYHPDYFVKLVSMKDKIESLYGSSLEWYTSPEKSYEKRIYHNIEIDIYDPNHYNQNFDWLISHFDNLRNALKQIDNE